MAAASPSKRAAVATPVASPAPAATAVGRSPLASGTKAGAGKTSATRKAAPATVITASGRSSLGSDSSVSPDKTALKGRQQSTQSEDEEIRLLEQQLAQMKQEEEALLRRQQEATAASTSGRDVEQSGQAISAAAELSSATQVQPPSTRILHVGPVDVDEPDVPFEEQPVPPAADNATAIATVEVEAASVADNEAVVDEVTGAVLQEMLQEQVSTDIAEAVTAEIEERVAEQILADAEAKQAAAALAEAQARRAQSQSLVDTSNQVNVAETQSNAADSRNSEQQDAGEDKDMAATASVVVETEADKDVNDDVNFDDDDLPVLDDDEEDDAFTGFGASANPPAAESKTTHEPSATLEAVGSGYKVEQPVASENVSADTSVLLRPQRKGGVQEAAAGDGSTVNGDRRSAYVVGHTTEDADAEERARLAEIDMDHERPHLSQQPAQQDVASAVTAEDEGESRPLPAVLTQPTAVMSSDVVNPAQDAAIAINGAASPDEFVVRESPVSNTGLSVDSGLAVEKDSQRLPVEELEGESGKLVAAADGLPVATDAGAKAPAAESAAPGANDGSALTAAPPVTVSPAAESQSKMASLVAPAAVAGPVSVDDHDEADEDNGGDETVDIVASTAHSAAASRRASKLEDEEVNFDDDDVPLGENDEIVAPIASASSKPAVSVAVGGSQQNTTTIAVESTSAVANVSVEKAVAVPAAPAAESQAASVNAGAKEAVVAGQEPTVATSTIVVEPSTVVPAPAVDTQASKAPAPQPEPASALPPVRAPVAAPAAESVPPAAPVGKDPNVSTEEALSRLTQAMIQHDEQSSSDSPKNKRRGIRQMVGGLFRRGRKSKVRRMRDGPMRARRRCFAFLIGCSLPPP